MRQQRAGRNARRDAGAAGLRGGGQAMHFGAEELRDRSGSGPRGAGASCPCLCVRV